MKRETKYLTKLGELGSGVGVNRDTKSATENIHDILVRAAEHALDVYVLCGSLREELRDNVFRELANRKTFADLVRDVLMTGANVSIFVWNDPSKAPHSPECVKLMVEARKHSEWGALEIWSSGTDEGGEKLNHFLIAKSRDDKKWILRVERPHPVVALDAREIDVPAAIFYDTADARKYGEPLLATFMALTGAVREGLKVRAPEGMHNIAGIEQANGPAEPKFN